MYCAVFVSAVITTFIIIIITITIAYIAIAAMMIHKYIGLPIEDKGELGGEAVRDVSPGAGAGVGTDDHPALGSGAVPDGHDGGRRAIGRAQ